ncbi:hypothetical protein O181_003233 [Austropuccinia psidii MF-1]|uniref:Uncharacterized protein n=1 Tax=Austropuccinia psidii MF-1 TaxID=1389203 RepID=A0A9Q3BE24_9BASI|nr:hypothetical protein [Austropuccinia psidii MF-1]
MDYQRMYGIDMYNSKNRNITIATNKIKKYFLDVYQFPNKNALEKKLNERKEGQLRFNLNSEQKLSLLKVGRKNRTVFSIGEEQLVNIRVFDIEFSLDVEGPYPPLLRRPPYPESWETGKYIEKISIKS